jgi:hypothetical protein
MASELHWVHTGTAKTVYATIRSAARAYWYTVTPALEALNMAHWADYDIALTETPASSYFYVGDWPAALTTAGFYWVDIFEQAGAGPVRADDTLLGGIIGYWTGTALLPWAADTTQVGGTAQTAGDLLGVWTPTKAGYLTGAVALEASLTAIKGAGWTTETLVAIDVLLDAIKAKTDTIGTGTTLTIVSPLVSSLLTVTIGGTLAATISGLTLSGSWTLMDFSLKRSADDTDANAILRIRVSNPAVGTTDGALIVEGVAATAGQRILAGLTVTAGAGTVAIAATAALTAALSTHAALVWDLKQWTAAAQTVVATGTALVQHTPTWAVV